MSVSDEEPYSTIFASLKHPIRRRILRMLSKKPMSFSEMLGVLGVSSSFLTYHLENLGELVGKIDDGKYRLSSFGEAAIATMTKVEDIPTTAPQQYSEHPETRSQKWSRPLRIIARAFKMSETRASETKPKKIVGRSVAIALGIICILLIAFIAYFSITGISAQNKYNNLQNQNKQLQKWLDGNLTLFNQTQMWLSGNITAYNQLQDEVSSIYILGTKNSTVLVNNETYPRYEGPTIMENNETVYFIALPRWFFWVPSAGYVSVLFSSNSTSTRVEVQYDSNGTFNILWFDVGSSGIIVFPVSPSTYSISFHSSLGKTSVFTVTITYYY